MCKYFYYIISFFLVSLCFNYSCYIYSQTQALYLVTIKDKIKGQYLISHPEKYLSHRAIERRRRNKISITEQDFPVSKEYLDSLQYAGAITINTSRWFNTVTIALENGVQPESIASLNFVTGIEMTRDGNAKKLVREYSKLDSHESEQHIMMDSSDYGTWYRQIEIENGQFLHQLGYKGEGVQIAILDAGFKDADKYESLTALQDEGRILDIRDFVYPRQNIYAAYNHGAEVLSTIASESFNLMGTAPHAMFYLLRTEDAESECPVEEDNWVAAAEFADSAGADIINTSLGYATFDNPKYNYSYPDMNGITARISRAAEIAASKGIIVVVSAGNSGDDNWHYISTPADAKNIISVGAVTSSKTKAAFSAFGPSSDGRVKPEIMAMGQMTIAEIQPGIYGTVSGTSFSAPIITGITACLLQAFPSVTSLKIRDAIIKTSNQFNYPDSLYGYGIPDYEKAYAYIKTQYNPSQNNEIIYPNPFDKYLVISTYFTDNEKITIECFNYLGSLQFKTYQNSGLIYLSTEIQNLSQGCYIFKLTSKAKAITIIGIKTGVQ
jgi:serine protease AprX